MALGEYKVSIRTFIYRNAGTGLDETVLEGDVLIATHAAVSAAAANFVDFGSSRAEIEAAKNTLG